MRRRAWNILCAVSLVLAFVLAWLWVRGVRVSDAVERHWYVEDGRAIRFADIRSERGRLTVSFGRSQILTPNPRTEPNGLRVKSRPAGVVDGGAIRRTFTQGWLGFRLFAANYLLPLKPPFQYGVTRKGATLPDGVLMFLLAVPPACWIVATRRIRRRARQGLCAKCGYDLRESPGRCPECGWVAGAPSPA